jgi:hypothetical protein
VIPITVSQIERGIENPCVDGSIPIPAPQLFPVRFNSGDYLFASFDFNADCLPVVSGGGLVKFDTSEI